MRTDALIALNVRILVARENAHGRLWQWDAGITDKTHRHSHPAKSLGFPTSACAAIAHRNEFRDVDDRLGAHCVAEPFFGVLAVPRTRVFVVLCES